MKRKILLILILIIFLSIVILNQKSENNVLNAIDNKSNMLSIMLETEAGSRNYNETVSFPSNGYYLNKNLSKCVNGSKISFSDGNLYVKGNKTDRCYAYFDKDELGSICRNQNLSECFIKNYKKDSTIIYHDGVKDSDTEQNANLEADDNSYRYAGANEEVNNYICFGTNNKDTCLKEKNKYLYRIIGFFQNDGQYEAKLIKADYANSDLLGKGVNKPGETINYDTDGSYYTYTTYGPKLNSKNNHEEQDAYSHRYRGSLEILDRYKYQENGTTETKADWPNSLLNTIHLNHNFLNSFDINWQNKITNHNWKYKGNSNSEISVGSKNSNKTIKTVYEHEIGINSDATTYNAKIGLMYVTDYLYAASSNNWTKWPFNGTYIYKENGVDSENVPIGTYDETDGTDYRNAIDENWMYLGLWEWTITPKTDAPGIGAFDVAAPGFINSPTVGTFGFVVRPVFYLTSSLMLVGGAGLANAPYMVS